MKNLIERLQEYGQSLEAYHLGCEFSDFCDDIVSELERLQTENTKLIAANKAVALDNRKLRNELEQVKRCIEIVEKQRDSAIEELENYMVQDVLDGNEPCEICAKASDTPCECCDPKWRGPKED